MVTTPVPEKAMVVSYLPKKWSFLYHLCRSQLMRDLAEKDNKEVGDFSGKKSSIEDKAETFSDSYMH